MTDLRVLLSPPTRNAPQSDLDAIVSLYSGAKVDEARALAGRIVQQYSSCEIVHNLVGALAAASGQLDEAVVFYDRAIAISPDYVEALNNRGIALTGLGRLHEAIDSFDAAIRFLPNYAEAHLNRGIALRMAKRFDEALSANDAALLCNPHLTEAINNRGNVLQDLYRFEQALVEYDRALERDPKFLDAYLNRGNVLHHLGRLTEAATSFARLIQLSPGTVRGHHGHGVVLKRLGRLAEAHDSFEKAVALDASNAAALSELVSLRAQMCIWRGADHSASLLELARSGKAVQPFHLLGAADDPELQLVNATNWANRHLQAQPMAELSGQAEERRADGAKIRIGYFSADFHNHATMALMIGLLELHDRSRFEIHAFSYGPRSSDAMRQRTVRAVDVFHDIAVLSDEAAAQFARDQGIDVAVDLKGHTEDGRLGIFAFRAAPCQIAYLGYPGTTGMHCLDYLIADPIVVPEDRQSCFAENILYLPPSYQINDAGRKISDKLFTRAELGLPENGFVFCCLNGIYKITPAEFDIWMRLLLRVENSVLMLIDDNPWAKTNLRQEAELRGVDAARIVFAERMPVADHLSRQRCADLFLDTFHINAHTTASDALWAGLPVLTKLGSTFAARVAGSVLYAVGLPELVTETAEAYETLAFELATDPARLSAVKAKLIESRTAAPLFNTELFTRNIENLFAEVAGRS